MCGITGFAERNHKAETARRIVKGMADLITYRGPDGEGYYVDDQVALGHRRLSIIDLEGGKQPMFNEDCLLYTSPSPRDRGAAAWL